MGSYEKRHSEMTSSLVWIQGNWTYLYKYLELAAFAQVLTLVLQACTLVYLARKCNGTAHMNKAKHV